MSGKSLRLLAVVVMMGLTSAFPATAQQIQPLQLGGVQGLDMRVLTRWGALLVPQPGAAGGTSLSPFLPFYVFEKTTAAGGNWLKVGPSRSRPPTGWVAEEKTVPWRQAVTLAFNNVPNRQPVMFFDKRAQLENLLTSPQHAERATRLLQDSQAGRPTADQGLIALEPRPLPDFNTSFYLLPILDIADVSVPGIRRQGGTKMVHVASLVAPRTNEPNEIAQQPAEDFKVGVVFVIDTTISMQKYIDRTRQAVRRIVERMRRSPMSGRISFGLVGFRDSLEGQPETADDYLVRVFYPLKTEFDPAAFETALGSMREARSSNVGFAEDGMAGIQAALNMDSWPNFPGRLIFYISDAPLREAVDERSSTKFAVRDASAKANTSDRPIAILPIFLQTPEGRPYHREAEEQLRALSYYQQLSRDLLLPVPDGNIERFGTRIDQMIDEALQLTERDQPLPPPSASRPTPDEEAQELLRNVGHVMRLAWLGNRRNVQVPELVEGWAADFDPTNPAARMSFDINVLLTRNQLNELYQSLGTILSAASARIDASGGQRSFITQLRHLLATAQTDPAAMQSLDGSLGTRPPNPSEIRVLGDLVSVYVQHLPYRSPLLTQPLAALEDASKQEILDILVDIRSKREAYKNFYQDHTRWRRLNPAAGFEEAVYPVPIHLLP